MWRGALRTHRLTAAELAGVACLLIIALVACGNSKPLAASTPTPTAIPTATATATSTPLPTATPVPTRAPTPRPTAVPTVAPPSVCIPASDVKTVSSQVVFTGNTSRRQVSLTFDSDGGSAGNAIAYLDILRAHGIRATWFLTGMFAQANPGIVRQIEADGHDIGNHTVDHPDLISPPRSDAFICAELVNANRTISAVTGRTTRPFFRPPSGDYNAQVRTLAARLGYRTIYWSIDPADWNSAHSAAYIENNIFSNLKPGAIILMHVNSAHETQALDAVIDGIEARGYTIMPLSQLLS
jgi:peptidoglycan-N-acetylglucosamine deacetylase